MRKKGRLARFRSEKGTRGERNQRKCRLLREKKEKENPKVLLLNEDEKGLEWIKIKRIKEN